MFCRPDCKTFDCLLSTSNNVGVNVEIDEHNGKECHKYLAGDSICQDEANTEACGYDGGDCCSPESIFLLCSSCSCTFHDSSTKYAEEEEDDDNDEILCPYNTSWIGDGLCHDLTNIPECSYDGDDCCLPLINDRLCHECICHLNQLRHKSACHGNE